MGKVEIVEKYNDGAFADKIIKIRTDKDLSQAQLGKALKISQSRIARIELGAEPHASDKLCEILEDYPERVTGTEFHKFAYRDCGLTLVERHYRRILGDETLPQSYRTILVRKNNKSFLSLIEPILTFSDKHDKKYSIVQVLTYPKN